MNVALLHYWLLAMRGGERVLEAIAGRFPGAPIYTHACRRGGISAALLSHPVHESFIAALPGARRSCQKYLPLMPLACRRWDFSGCDLIISSESGPVKGVRKPAGCRHLCYCHTPMRYLWDLHDDYYRRANPLERLAMRVFTPGLRRADLRSAEGVDLFLANSRFVAERIMRIYHRSARVVYPPVDCARFAAAAGTRARDYYLYVGALVPYKDVDALLEAFRGFPARLVVAGTGPLERRLRKLAPPNVEFLGWVADAALPSLYAGAKALLFPGVEDFGIVPVEAQAAGTPVLALRRGGALETVVEGETGLFFDEPAPRAIRSAIEEADARAWPSAAFARNAARFSPAMFARGLDEALAVLFGSGPGPRIDGAGGK